jgi:hypothetical protein
MNDFISLLYFLQGPCEEADPDGDFKRSGFDTVIEKLPQLKKQMNDQDVESVFKFVKRRLLKNVAPELQGSMIQSLILFSMISKVNFGY